MKLSNNPHVNVFFDNVETIQAMNDKFLAEMQERVAHWEDRPEIGDLFVKYSKKFTIYGVSGRLCVRVRLPFLASTRAIREEFRAVQGRDRPGDEGEGVPGVYRGPAQRLAPVS